MPLHTDWETPLAEIRGVANTLDFIGEGQSDSTLEESLWTLARVLRERAKGLEAMIHAYNTAAIRAANPAGSAH